MESKSIWANLVSSDLDRTRTFYTDLGFRQNGPYQAGVGVGFFFGKNDFAINFFTPERLGQQTNGSLSLPVSGNEILFSLSAESKEAVDAWAEKVKTAGGTVFSAPRDYELGYTFGFADPDGHRFNVLYWPGM